VDTGHYYDCYVLSAFDCRIPSNLASLLRHIAFEIPGIHPASVIEFGQTWTRSLTGPACRTD
jgi:hypothetical protein